MLGFVGICAQPLAGEDPAPPSLEMLRDPGFDSPSDWTSAGGSHVTGSQLISDDDSGSIPTFGALRPEMGGAFVPTSAYRLRCTVGLLPGGGFYRVYLFGDSGTQLLGFFDTADPIDEVFVADGPYTAVMVQFGELGVRLNDLSIELVPP